MTSVKFPKSLLKPIADHLRRKEQKLENRKKSLDDEDPFKDEDDRTLHNDPDEDASEQAGHQRVQGLKKEVDKTLIKVRKALTRIRIGQYGVCESCGKMINTDRLSIDPTAELCVKCASKKND